jgi:hypothetical protein
LEKEITDLQIVLGNAGQTIDLKNEAIDAHLAKIETLKADKQNLLTIVQQLATIGNPAFGLNSLVSSVSKEEGSAINAGNSANPTSPEVENRSSSAQRKTARRQNQQSTVKASRMDTGISGIQRRSFMGEDGTDEEGSNDNKMNIQMPESSTISSTVKSSLIGLAERLTTAIPLLFSTTISGAESTTSVPSTTSDPTTSSTSATINAHVVTTSTTSKATGPATTTAIPTTTESITDVNTTEFLLKQEDVEEHIGGEDLGSGSEELTDVEAFQQAETRKTSARLIKPMRGFFARKRFSESSESGDS